MTDSEIKRVFTRYPVINLGAEYLVMGRLMRRNILTYKAPPNNEGYDLICIHPDPREKKRPIRIQVKSRLQTDSNRILQVKERSLDAFDYLIGVFLNVGYFYKRGTERDVRVGARAPEFYTFPVSFIRKHHMTSTGWDGMLKVEAKGPGLDRYKDEAGFERIADKLGIAYPDRSA